VPWACFREQEDAQGYFLVMRETVTRLGVPMSAYADRHSIFFQGKEAQLRKLSLEEQLAGKREPTQFGRLLNELGVDQANQVLWRFLPRHNRRFSVAAQDLEPAWIDWPPDQRLDEYFCFKYRRVVDNDNTVRFGEHVIDIPSPPDRRTSYARARVELQERFDGVIAVYLSGHCIAKKVIADPKATYRTRPRNQAPDQPPPPRPSRARKPAATPAGPAKPPANHPWRRPILAAAVKTVAP